MEILSSSSSSSFSSSFNASNNNAVVTHSGGCHCGRIRFKFKAPEKLLMVDCNCSICYKTGKQRMEDRNCIIHYSCACICPSNIRYCRRFVFFREKGAIATS